MGEVQHTTGSVVEVVKKDLTWLQKHERMVICALVLMVAMFLGNKWMDSSAARDKSRADVAAQLAADAKLSAQQAVQQAAQTQAQYQAMVDALTKQNAALAQAVTSRNIALASQQAQIRTAPLPQVAQQWQAAIGGSDDLTMGATGLTVTEDGARRTVGMLIEVPVLRSNLADEVKIAQNTQTELDKANSLIVEKDGVISAKDALIGANDKSCKAQIDSVKADARKSKRNWFIGGSVVGVAIRSAIHAYFGI